MATAAGATIFLLFLPLFACEATGDPAGLVRAIHSAGGGRHSTSMVLPLVLSHANHSRLRPSERSNRWRRQLQRAERQGRTNAQMRLYDDLLTNGYYTTRLYIGTPPQEFALIVDSGSTVTYVPCSTCEQCGNHQDPRFQPDLSSTFEPVKCNIHCNCDKEKGQCVYERQYAEMSSSSGVLGTDVISFGNESALEPQSAVFGCENMETGDLFSQHADGIMGLGRGSLSIMDQLVDKNVISDSFSLCYGGMDIGGGAMVLGSIPSPPGMVFSRSDPVRSPYYNIELKEIRVSGEALNLNPKVFDAKHGTVLDSGTTYAYLPEAAFTAFKEAVMAQVHPLKQIPGPDPTYKDICFSGAGSDVSQLSNTFPEVDMVFSNGQKLSLSPENYLFRHSKAPGAYCLGIFQNGKDPTTLLGGIVVRNTLVTYDRENHRIGFWKTNCSELWENSSPPSDYFNLNRSIETPSSAPSQAPSGMQDYRLTDHIRVGLITFDMSLSIGYSDLVPHITELTELIAQNLDVNASQVQMISLENEGSGSLIRWAIYPAGPDDFISNAIAMGIISQLSEHRVRLPENFGSYELVKWKVEPVSKRAWKSWHVVAISLGVAAVIVLCLSAFLGWYVWKRKQERGTYRPVDAPGPEHELQPL